MWCHLPRSLYSGYCYLCRECVSVNFIWFGEGQENCALWLTVCRDFCKTFFIFTVPLGFYCLRRLVSQPVMLCFYGRWYGIEPTFLGLFIRSLLQPRRRSNGAVYHIAITYSPSIFAICAIELSQKTQFIPPWSLWWMQSFIICDSMLLYRLSSAPRYNMAQRNPSIKLGCPKIFGYEWQF